MTTRIYFLLSVMLVITLNTSIHAQTVIREPATYRGLEAHMGVHSLKLNSTIPELNKLQVVATGGSAAYLFGWRNLLVSSGAGFYYSNDCVEQTVDLFSANVKANFYPLQGNVPALSKWRPYLQTGVYYNQLRFAGMYLDDKNERRNYSVSYDTYIGKVTEFTLVIGAGVEYRIFDEDNFFYLFAEANNAAPIGSRSNEQAFSNTAASSHVTAQIGFRVGMRR